MTIMAMGVLLHWAQANSLELVVHWTQANSFEFVVLQSHGHPQERQTRGESRRGDWGNRSP